MVNQCVSLWCLLLLILWGVKSTHLTEKFTKKKEEAKQKVVVHVPASSDSDGIKGSDFIKNLTKDMDVLSTGDSILGVGDIVGDTISIAANLTSISTIAAALQLLVATTTYVTQEWPKSADIKDGEEFDFIVVGAGSAGSVVATRLAESGNYSVLLVEKGGDPPLTSVISGLFALLTHSPQDWDYDTISDGFTSQAQNNGRVSHTRGKMLGGSSALDHLMYIRGSSEVFDDWSKMGNEGWDYESCLKYFKKSESNRDKNIMLGPTRKYHGIEGPLIVSPSTENKYFEEKENIMLEAFEELLNIKSMEDVNVPNPIGSGRCNYKVSSEGVRSSTAQCYLLGVKDEKNFFVLKNTLTSKIIFEDNIAIGVELILESGEKIKVFSKKEVIISAGVFNSPQLLMLSGVGPSEELEKFNIDIVLDQPKVGKNLMDHVHAPVVTFGKLSPTSTLETALSVFELKTFPFPLLTGLFNVDKYPLEQPPELQHITFTAGAASPLLYFVCRVNFNFNSTICDAIFKDSLLRESFYSLVILSDPLSRGSVTLKSADPNEAPEIVTGFFEDECDLETLGKGIKKLHELQYTSYFNKSGGSFFRPPLPECDKHEFKSDEYWKCYARVMASTTYHPAGTCAMGPEGVVDHKLKVRGLSNIRVVDASVFPKLPSTNIDATVIMVAEYAADMIKEELNSDYDFEI